MSDHRKKVAEGVRTTLVRLVEGAVPAGALTSTEVEALVGLCMMGVGAVGDEDPKALASQVSDPILEFLVARIDELQANVVLQPVCQILVFEWCFRNGHLNADWRWEWVGPSTGQAHISPRLPLEQVPLPKKQQVRAR